MNQFVGVGRLVAKPEVKTSENGKTYANFTVAVPRSYKNADGEYETDFIDVVAFGQISESTAEYCNKGDVIGVKGRIETRNFHTCRDCRNEFEGRHYFGIDKSAARARYKSISVRRNERNQTISNRKNGARKHNADSGHPAEITFSIRKTTCN